VGIEDLATIRREHRCIVESAVAQFGGAGTIGIHNPDIVLVVRPLAENDLAPIGCPAKPLEIIIRGGI